MVVGYQFQADQYCEECIVEVAASTRLNASKLEELSTEEALDLIAEAEGIDRTDEYSYDSDNFPKEILDSQEAGDRPDTCGACHELLDTSWSGYTVDYVVAQLWDYVTEAYNHRQNAACKECAPEFNHKLGTTLDDWRERLGNCIISDFDEAIVDIYDRWRYLES